MGETKVQPWNTTSWVETLADLRNQDPKVDGHYIVVGAYSSEIKTGGGLFIYDKSDKSTQDDSGYCIVTNTGARYKRNTPLSELTPMHFGAIGDGVADDSAVLNRMLDRVRRINLDRMYFIKSPIMASGLTQVDIVGKGKGTGIFNDPLFVSPPEVRGLIALSNCSNINIFGFTIQGDYVDKLNANEPWQDGDTGIELINCSGYSNIYDMVLDKFKAWGIIHVECTQLDSRVYNSRITRCLVQSGIGGTGYRSLVVDSCHFENIGLYCVEMETRNQNQMTRVTNCTAMYSNKGYASVHNSDNLHLCNNLAYCCKTGFSSLSDPNNGANFQGNNQLMMGNISNSCYTSFELVYPESFILTENVEFRDKTEFYIRTRALDRFVHLSGNQATIALDSADENVTDLLGKTIELEDGKQVYITALSDRQDDAVFRDVVTLTLSEDIGSSYVRQSFKRYVEIQSDKTSVVLYGGKDVSITNNKFAWATRILSSFGKHSYLNWENNTSYSCAKYFDVGSDGVMDNCCIKIEEGQNLNFGVLGAVDKFKDAFMAERVYVFPGGTTNNLSTIQHSFPLNRAAISGAKVSLALNATTTGTIVFKLNNTDVVVGFSGSPLRGEARFTPIQLEGVAFVQMADTVGDLTLASYAVRLRGAFV